MVSSGITGCSEFLVTMIGCVLQGAAAPRTTTSLCALSRARPSPPQLRCSLDAWKGLEAASRKGRWD
jgi:hypothetical protein